MDGRILEEKEIYQNKLVSKYGVVSRLTVNRPGFYGHTMANQFPEVHVWCISDTGLRRYGWNGLKFLKFFLQKKFF